MLIEILPHPTKADQRIIPIAISTRVATDAGERAIITVTGTDGSEDRHGSQISPDGWDVKSFNANPVVTWSHQDDLIPAIGRAPSPRHVGGNWDFDIEFAIEQWREYAAGNLAALIYKLMKDDYLRAVSVAFIPKEWEDYEAKSIPSFFAEGIRYMKQELTAISPCNVPSNRNAMKKALGDKVISENEATLLGLGAMVRIEMPYTIVGKAKKVDAKTFRTKLTAVLSRCCGCVEYVEPAPLEVSPETKASEIATMNEIAVVALDLVETGLAGWKTSKHDPLRNQCAGFVSQGMYWYDWVAYWLMEWYEEEIGGTIPDIDFEDIEQVTAAAPEAFMRAAEMFRGPSKLDEILEIVSEIREQRPQSNMIRISGVDSRGQRVSESPTFLVSGLDASAGRAVEQSPSPERPNLYRVMLADD